MVIEFFVPATPRAMPRKLTLIRSGHRFFPKMYIPHDVKAWKDLIRATLRTVVNQPLRLPYPARVDLKFYFPTNDRTRPGNPHLYKPDLDNLEKPVLDAISEGQLWLDDCQVYSVTKTKAWAGKDSNAGCRVRVEFDLPSNQEENHEQQNNP